MAGWRVEGQYMETCNCTYLCPCISSNLTARPTEGDCKAAIAMRIDKGEKDGVKLDGLSFIVLMHSPRRWRRATSRSASSSTSAPPTSRPRRSARSPRARLADRWRRSGRSSGVWLAWKSGRSASRMDGLKRSGQGGRAHRPGLRGCSRTRAPRRTHLSRQHVPPGESETRARQRPLAAASTPSGSTGTIPAVRATAISRPSRGRGNTSSHARPRH